MRKCAKCGASNADGMARCGNCGSPLSDSPMEEAVPSGIRKIWSDRLYSGLKDSPELTSVNRQEESLVAIALNIRRIFILFLYLVIVIVMVELFGLWAQTFSPDYYAMRAVSIGLGISICLVGLVLVYAAVFLKGLSRES